MTNKYRHQHKRTMKAYRELQRRDPRRKPDYAKGYAGRSFTDWGVKK